MGQVPPKYFLPSSPYGASPSANALNPSQAAAQNPQTPLLPPNFQDPGTMPSQSQALQGSLPSSGGSGNPFAPNNPYGRNQMFGRGLFSALLLLFFSTVLSATTTVTGTLQNLGTGAVGANAFVRFWLRGCGGNQPRVSGTAVIAPSQGGVFYFDFIANASGNVSGTLYSTRDVTGLLGGDITCGTSSTSVWYGMQVFVGGKGGPEIPVHALNTATLNISSVTPITTNPIVTAPTGDSTYFRKDAGNSPITGPTQINNSLTVVGLIQCKNENNIRCVDENNSAGWAGSDVCAQIASAIGDLSSAGGVVDARGVLTARSCAANPFASVAKPILLLLPGVTFTLNAKWTISTSDIVIRGTGERATVLQAGAGLTNSAVIEMGDNLAVYFGVRLEDLRVHCGGNTGCTPILMRGLNEESGVRRVLLSDYRTNGIKADGSVQNTGNFEISDSEVTTAAGAGIAGDGIFLNATQGQIRVARVSVVANNLQTSAAIHNTAATTSNFLEDLHVEKFTDGVSCDAGAVHVVGVAGFAATVNTVHVKTGCNGVSLVNTLNNSNSNSNPVILNDISGTNLSSQNPPSPGGFISMYNFAAGWSESWLDNNGFHYTTNSSSRALFDQGNLALSGLVTNFAQTSTMGLTLKTGAASNYTGTNTTYAAVDTTNLCTVITVPTGWKLKVEASGVLESATAAVAQSVALADTGATCTSGGVTALNGTERTITPPAIATFDEQFHTQYVLTGDGNPHSLALMAKTSNAADAWAIQSSSVTLAPSMIFTLMPSN